MSLPITLTDVDDFRARSIQDKHTGCWHFLRTNGERYPENKSSINVMTHHGCMTLTKAIALLAHRMVPGYGEVAYRTCRTLDCCNPKHITVGSKSEHRQVSMKPQTKRMTPQEAMAAAMKHRTVWDWAGGKEPVLKPTAQAALEVVFSSALRPSMPPDRGGDAEDEAEEVEA